MGVEKTSGVSGWKAGAPEWQFKVNYSSRKKNPLASNR